MLNDTDLMPFGKYKGKAMQDVPVSYLHWLWHNNTVNSFYVIEVIDYIKRSLDALKSENKDLVWKRD